MATGFRTNPWFVFTSKALMGLPLAALVSCGGGGGGGSTSGPTALTLTFQNQAQANAYQGEGFVGGPGLRMATLIGNCSPAPTTAVFPVISFDAQGFAPLLTSATADPSGNFTINLGPDTALQPGVYTGNMGVQIFHDINHTSPYQVTGGQVPFSVTITPMLTLSLNGGGSFTTQNHNLQALITSGNLVDLASNLPVTWSYQVGTGLVVFNPGAGVSTTLWTGTVALAAQPTTTTGVLTATALDGSGQVVPVTFAVQ
jgi:hypothetical protein